MTTTVETQFNLTGGRPSGFDYMRICLSVSVIAYHTIIVCYGLDADLLLWGNGDPYRPFISWTVPSFFALSGFLVAGSLFRNSIPGFLALRASRIFPALGCELLLSALIIGPMLTVIPLSAYFSDKSFYTYFLNLVGNMHYTLPGVFMHNPTSNRVNLQLWTIPYEMQCYIVLTLLALFRVIQKPRLFALVFVFATLFAYACSVWWIGFNHSHHGPSGQLLVLSFLSGVLIYIWRGKIPLNTVLVCISVLAAWYLLRRLETEYFAAFPVAYVTVWLGLKNPKKIFLIAGADYSYGMYLYGFPVQQVMIQLFPFNYAWYVNLILSLAGAAIAAYLSWNLLETKALTQKGRVVAAFTFVSTRMGALMTALLPRGLFILWDRLLNVGDIVERYLLQAENLIRKAR